MYTTLTTLIDRLDCSAASETSVIPWGCPVPSFGDATAARVATLGLNPSNREFVDEAGNELQGTSRRFHTLTSLGIDDWADVDARHLRMIQDACCKYFYANPYDRWFKKLDQIISGTNASFYDPWSSACHLDLIPYATSYKWASLTGRQRSLLLDVASDTLGRILRESSVKILILNGKSVVEHFQYISGVTLNAEEMSDWSLPRQSKRHVIGYSYQGVIDTLSGIALTHQVLVLGFNHNIQSSFGVTTDVTNSIRDWITQVSKEVTS